MARLSHTFSPALVLCFGIQVGHRHDPHNFWINNVPVLKTDEVVEQHLAQRQGSVHLLVVHFRCDSHILFQLPHGKLETQLRTLKPAPQSPGHLRWGKQSAFSNPEDCPAHSGHNVMHRGVGDVEGQ